jgi:predicted unusual protein kinase regulating ubiquinone biosynthesis (AarF/ABC1/UbiB family)
VQENGPAPPLGRPGARLRFTWRRLGVVQGASLLGWAASALTRELAGRLGDLLAREEERDLRRERRRERTARALVAVLGALKGPFVKLGQFASLRVDLLPARIREQLGTLQDRVPPLPFSEIREVVESELGERLEARFQRFDPEPIGAASIAQAHRAWLHGGEAVVVKVQYPWLATSVRTDLAILRVMVTVWSWARPGARLDPQRLFAEFATSVSAELDFEREADVAAEVSANLQGDAAVVVPRVLRAHSTRRVLVMLHYAAVRITDEAGLRRLGVSPRDILEILARAYAKQIFVDGVFHADPHPGNLFVVDEPEARTRPRVLFVDFGLSRRLTLELRAELRRGVYALLAGDQQEFLAGMERMQMIAPDAHAGVDQAVASMFARIGAETSSPLALGGNTVLALKDDAKRLLEETPGLQLPTDLLLYAKTLSYLFGLGTLLAPEVDLMRLSVPYLLRFLAEKEVPATEPSGQKPIHA